MVGFEGVVSCATASCVQIITLSADSTVENTNGEKNENRSTRRWDDLGRTPVTLRTITLPSQHVRPHTCRTGASCSFSILPRRSVVRDHEGRLHARSCPYVRPRRDRKSKRL